MGLFFSLGFVLQVLAIVVWARRGGDRFWIWIIILGGAVGALAYFIVEAMPDLNQLMNSFQGPERRRKIAELRALVRDNPAGGNYEQLGELLIQEKKWTEARKAFDAAIASRPDLIDSFYGRGIASDAFGDHETAINDLQHVVAINPKHDYSRALSLLGQVLARSGRTAEASAVFDRLVKSTSATEPLVIAAEFYFVQQRFNDAHELIDTILTRREAMPSYQRRRDAPWLRKAKALEKELRKAQPQPEKAFTS